MEVEGVVGVSGALKDPTSVLLPTPCVVHATLSIVQAPLVQCLAPPLANSCPSRVFPLFPFHCAGVAGAVSGLGTAPEGVFVGQTVFGVGNMTGLDHTLTKVSAALGAMNFSPKLHFVVGQTVYCTNHTAKYVCSKIVLRHAQKC